MIVPVSGKPQLHGYHSKTHASSKTLLSKIVFLFATLIMLILVLVCLLIKIKTRNLEFYKFRQYLWFYYLNKNTDGPELYKTLNNNCYVNQTVLNYLSAHATSSIETTSGTYHRFEHQKINIASVFPCLRPILQESSIFNDKTVPKNVQKCFTTNQSNYTLFKLYEILKVLDQLFKEHKLDYMLSDGSLLGSRRHFGMIPWDTDVDFLIPSKQKPRFLNIFQQLKQNRTDVHFRNTEDTNQHWRLDACCTNRTDCSIGIDYFFYDIIGETELIRPEHPFFYFKKYMFPVQSRPYGPLLLPAPRLPLKVLNRVYNSDELLSQCQLHLVYKPEECLASPISCQQLYNLHPFVQTVRITNSLCLELLIHDSVLIASFESSCEYSI